MNFNLKKEDFEIAQFNMIAEILAQSTVCKEMLVEIYAKQEGLDYSAALAKIEKRIDQHRKAIDQKLDADYGHIDIKDIK